MSAAAVPGFPDRMSFIPVPTAMFGALLREVDTLGELKATLHVWRLLHERRSTPRFVRRSELLADRALLLALRTVDPDDPGGALDDALRRCADRGTLLAIAVADGDVRDVCYLLNTSQNRRLRREIEDGKRKLGPLGRPPPPADVGGPDPDRPSIFELYEQNVGLLTPLLAEELREAEQTYPAVWIEDAFREAVVANKRSWRYVKRVLETWADRGRGSSGETRGRPEPPEDSHRYIAGRYGHLVRR